MELVSITVRNFRSITEANKLHIKRSTVLLGPNNEGKSNILRALVAGLTYLTRYGKRFHRFGKKPIPSFLMRRIYNWDRDIPVHMKKSVKSKTDILLEFKLTEEEIEEFILNVGSNLNGNLPIEVSFGKNDVKVTVRKRGRGGPALSKKSARIARFVSRRFEFQYIPAIRTAESAQKIVEQIVARELEAVEDDPKFAKALKQIEDIQRPILEEISSGIQKTLGRFLPDIKYVKVDIEKEERNEALRRHCSIVIDDGTPTELQYKGDGVQSLAALGIMRHASDKGTKNKNLILAIEEPESHLHPAAIHELRDVLSDLSISFQVFITTHCPLFVDRTNVKSNIIVVKKKAQPAKNVEAIRKALGVKASDNLRHAEFVIIVEGEDDKIALQSLLSYHSKKLGKALNENTIAIDTLGGASNLSYKAGLVRDALCSFCCFLDNDNEAHRAADKAINNGLLKVADIKYAILPGRRESEIEDLYNVSLYENFVLHKYGVSLKDPKFKIKRKWSERIAETFKHQGQRFGDKTETEIKMGVAELVALSPDKTLNDKIRSPFDALVVLLENRI